MFLSSWLKYDRILPLTRNSSAGKFGTHVNISQHWHMRPVMSHFSILLKHSIILHLVLISKCSLSPTNLSIAWFDLYNSLLKSLPSRISNLAVSESPIQKNDYLILPIKFHLRINKKEF